MQATTTSKVSPLQITKALLKPWSPCSDGYKWFVSKFPQGAEFSAVQKALREDKRFDDVRWLTDMVWLNLMLDTPATTLDVVADHKAEALEIIEEATSLKVEAPTAAELAAGASATDDALKPMLEIADSICQARENSLEEGIALLHKIFNPAPATT